MKAITTILGLLSLLISSAGIAYAVPQMLNGKESDPNFVVYYPDGPHGIVGESGIDHEGEDLVMRAGKSGNFEQWFFGTSPEEGLHGEHSIWQVKRHGECPDDFVLVPNAFPEWGDYLEPDTGYCVKTNDFNANDVKSL